MKIIKPGMDTRDVIARFEAERQALAMMDHREYRPRLRCRDHRIGTSLFRDGVDSRRADHRLLRYEQADRSTNGSSCSRRFAGPFSTLIRKESFIEILSRRMSWSLLHDGRPVPKVIDFGIAKALNQRLTDKTIYTRVHQAIGTLAYMSPEQAELSGLDMDTRADVYGLGVLAYELLTGTTPFDSQRLNEAAFTKHSASFAKKNHREPASGSARSGATATAVSAQRRTDPSAGAEMHGRPRLDPGQGAREGSYSTL